MLWHCARTHRICNALSARGATSWGVYPKSPPHCETAVFYPFPSYLLGSHQTEAPAFSAIMWSRLSRADLAAASRPVRTCAA